MLSASAHILGSAVLDQKKPGIQYCIPIHNSYDDWYALLRAKHRCLWQDSHQGCQNEWWKKKVLMEDYMPAAKKSINPLKKK